MSKSIRLLTAVIFLFMMTVILVNDSQALWGRKKFSFTVVDGDGEVLKDITCRAMNAGDGYEYNDASIWETENSATGNYSAYLTVDADTGIVEFWGKENLYDIRITRGIRWDIVKDVYTTTHKLLYLDRYLLPQGLGSSPESAPGMFMIDNVGGQYRAWIALGSYGDCDWFVLSPQGSYVASH